MEARDAPNPLRSANSVPPAARPPHARRRCAAESAVASDLLGLRVAACGQLLLLLARTVIKERLPWLALVNGSHAMLAHGLSLLVVYRRDLWVRRRSLLITLLMAHLTWVVGNGGARRGVLGGWLEQPVGTGGGGARCFPAAAPPFRPL